MVDNQSNVESKQYALSLISRLTGYLVLLAFVMGNSSPLVYAREGVVKVGVYDNPPISYEDQRGKYKGLSVEVLQHIASEEGWSLEYVPGTWHECLARLESGETDIQVYIAYSQERARKYDFSNETLFSNWGQVFCQSGSDIDSILDLKNKTVVLLKRAIHNTAFRELTKKLDIECKIIEADSNHAVLSLVQDKKADAGVVNRVFGDTRARDYSVNKTSIIFNPIEVRYAVPKGKNHALVTTVDTRLAALKRDPGSMYHLALRKTFGAKSEPVLPRWAMWTLGSVTGLLLLILFGNIVLRRQVKLKTTELVTKNRELKEENIQRMRAEKALRKSEQELRVRNRIAEIFLTTADDKMYDEVLQVVLDAMDSKYGTFAYINEDGDRVVPSMTGEIWEKCQMLEKTIFFPRNTWGKNLWARCLKEKRTVSAEGPFKLPDGHLPVSRALAVPIIHRGEVVGNFMVGDKATDYDEKDKELLESIADHTAPILHARIQRARLDKDRKHAEEALRESEERFNLAVNATLDGIWDWNILTNEEYFAPRWCEILGYSHDDPELLHVFESWASQIHADDYERVMDAVKAHLEKGNTFDIDYRHRHKSGEYRWQNSRGQAVFDEKDKPIRMVGCIRDITDQKEAAVQIKASLKEKEVLLQEVHHRVKNNMQVIMSLLRLQSDSIDDQKYADLLKESQDRIKSMALIHEKFYQSDNFADIDFDEYVRSLSTELFRSYGADPNKIALKTQIEDISLMLDYAIPCGLIVNELISNSLKYAFPEGREGEIKVVFRSTDSDELDLTVSDDGIGLPKDLDVRNTESLGLHLVSVLAEHQLGGKLDVRREKGTEFRLRFKLTGYKARI